MKRVPLTLALYLLFANGTLPFSVRLFAEEPDRTTLPITEPLRQPTTTLDVRKATPPARFEVKAPDGAPNVLLVLIDDLGFPRQYRTDSAERRAACGDVAS